MRHWRLNGGKGSCCTDKARERKEGDLEKTFSRSCITSSFSVRGCSLFCPSSARPSIPSLASFSPFQRFLSIARRRPLPPLSLPPSLGAKAE